LQLCEYCYSICIIDHKYLLGLKGHRKISLTDLHSRFTREIEISAIVHPESALQVNKNEVLISADNGIFVVTNDLVYKYQIIVGDYDGISYDSRTGKAAAVSTDIYSNHVSIIEKQAMQWTVVNKFNIKHHIVDKHYFGTIHINGSVVYIAILHEDIIVKYTFDGRLLNVYGIGKHGGILGTFIWPRICGTDVKGHLIICDTANKRFQILDWSERWHEIKLNGIIPQDIVSDGNVTYILHGDWGHKKIAIYKL
jgi:hypothetical protein